MAAVFHMSSMTRSHLLSRHDFYVEQIRKRVLSQFDDIDGEADEYAQTEYERMGQLPGSEDSDMSCVADTAHERAVEYYQLLSDLRQQTYLSAVAGMYHQFDKDLREFLETQLVGLVDGKTGNRVDYDYTKRNLWKPPIEDIFGALKELGWDLRKEPYYPQLDACRMVVNAYKHGKGGSLDSLRANYPQYVKSPLEEKGLEISGQDDFIDHEWLKVSANDFDELSNAIRQFWDSIPRDL